MSLHHAAPYAEQQRAAVLSVIHALFDRLNAGIASAAPIFVRSEAPSSLFSMANSALPALP
jgi:hypothetical protein